MARGEEQFLARWSRLKREHRHDAPDAPTPAALASAPRPAAPASAPRTEEPAVPALPPVETLTPESDFTVFMNPKVADALRRAALKRLFRHPEIDVPDPFEPFCDDLTGGDPIPDEMLKSLLQARDAILRPGDPKAEAVQPQSQAPTATAPEPAPAAQALERADEDAGKQDA